MLGESTSLERGALVLPSKFSIEYIEKHVRELLWALDETISTLMSVILLEVLFIAGLRVFCLGFVVWILGLVVWKNVTMQDYSA